MCTKIQNIPSKIRKKVMTSNFRISQVTAVKTWGSTPDVNKRNIPNVTEKRNRATLQTSKAMLSTPDTKEQSKMDTQENEKVKVENSVNKTKLFCTSICRTKVCQDNECVKDSETEENVEDIQMSKMNTERKDRQQQLQIRNKKFVLGTDLTSSRTEVNSFHNGDNVDCTDYAPPSALSSFPHSNDEPAVQQLKVQSDVHNTHKVDCTDSAPPSAPNSSLHCNEEPIQQTNIRSDVLPQHSPVHYALSDVYSVSTSTLHISRNTKIYSVQCKLRFS